LFLKYGLKGEKKKALEVITSQLTTVVRWDEHLSWTMADCYALIDEREEALDWLEHAAMNRGRVGTLRGVKDQTSSLL
jgi:hypothetical protein